MTTIQSSTSHIASQFPSSISNSLYHVTKLANLDSILKHGLKTSCYGDIHGEMAIHPREKTIYLSRKPSSDNLHSALFDDNSPLVVIEINPSFINHDSIYPDDALFIGFGEEILFVDADDIQSDLKCDTHLSNALLTLFESCLDKDLPDAMKHLWPWYLQEHGEISVSHDIPPNAIIDYKKI